MVVQPCMKESITNRPKYQNFVAHSRIQRGQGVRTPPPLEYSQNIGFLSNNGLDPLKITKLPSQHSMLGHIGQCVIWIVFPLIKKKKKSCQSWTPSGKTFWIRAWLLKKMKRMWTRGLYMKFDNLLIFLLNLICCCFCT